MEKMICPKCGSDKISICYALEGPVLTFFNSDGEIKGYAGGTVYAVPTMLKCSECGAGLWHEEIKNIPKVIIV